MDIKEIALRIGLEVFEEHPYDNGHVVSPSGYTWIDDKLIEFAEALIESYKAELLNEVGEPFGWWHQGETDDESDFYLAESRAGEDCSACTQLFTSDQLIAARKGLEEEIERLKDQLEAAQEELSQADCLNGKIIAENGTLKEQLATAEQEDIIEMRADHLKLTEENHALREQLATAEQRVAEACARTCESQFEHYDGTKENCFDDVQDCADALRYGQYRKYMKEV